MYKNWRDLIKPKQLQVEKESLSATYGKFYAEPFERGFGTTLGNSLRRILLSSLQGAAITAVRIKGVLHEFSTIQGVTEDVTDIILNLKGVRLKLHSSDSATIHIKHKGEGLICASDILVGHNVEIMNPEHVVRWIDGQFIKVLNVAGPRESKYPEGIYSDALTYMEKVFLLLKEVN